MGHTGTYIQSMAIPELYFNSIIMASRLIIVFLIKKLIGMGSVRIRRSDGRMLLRRIVDEVL
jgi:hypothetical protein